MLKAKDFAWTFSIKYRKQLLDTATKTGINTSKKVINKAAEATGKFLRNETVDAVAKLYNDKIVKTRPVAEIIIPPVKEKKY